MRKSKYTGFLVVGIAIFWVTYRHSCSNSNERTVVQRQELPSTDHVTREPAARAKVLPKAPELEVSDDNPRYQTVRDQYPYGHDMHDILEKNPYLATLLDFKNRPLLDPAARAQYEQFLSNEKVIQSAQAGLLDPGNLNYSLAESITREMNVDFFEMAMNWKTNPARNRLIDTMESIILKDNFIEAQTDPVQKSLAQSKISLFKILYEANVERARDIVARVHGTRMEALITYAREQQEHVSAN